MFKVIGHLYKLKAYYENTISTQETLIRKIKQQKYSDVPELSEKTKELMTNIQEETETLKQNILLYATELNVEATLDSLIESCGRDMKKDILSIKEKVMQLEKHTNDVLLEASDLIQEHMNELDC